MSEVWRFRVYIAGETLIGKRAVENLRALVERHLDEEPAIEVIDLGADPKIALRDRVLAVPTVVRVEPEPELRAIGDLSDGEEAREALGL